MMKNGATEFFLKKKNSPEGSKKIIHSKVLTGKERKRSLEEVRDAAEG